jgi:hypothetical protein
MILGNFYDFPYRNSIFLLQDYFPPKHGVFRHAIKVFHHKRFLPSKNWASSREVKNVPNLLLNARLRSSYKDLSKQHQPCHLEVGTQNE